MALSRRSSRLKSEAARKERMASPWVQARLLRTVVITEPRSRSPAARSAAAVAAGRPLARAGLSAQAWRVSARLGGEQQACDRVQGALVWLSHGHDDLDGTFDEITGHVGEVGAVAGFAQDEAIG